MPQSIGFLQRDIERLVGAITGAVAPAGLGPYFSPSVIARATKLAQDAASMPIEDARRAKKALQRIAENAGIPLP
ncbi:hypothetical protein LCGC14_0833130 [marine sediment metagenome]|uniref:Uncharacterized protein n=1 Tax=marine sediment metagenome TaxID=412755 RepID=A0A0F9SMM9_9ZZZZ